MSSPPFQRVAEVLPFALDDTAAVNDVFARWCANASQKDLKLVELWTYGYVQRYYFYKMIRGELKQASDLDALVEKAHTRAQSSRDTVRNPKRYANWVSVICKHTFLNYQRGDRHMDSLDDEEAPTLPADTLPPIPEGAFLRQPIENAIEALPDYLQVTARMCLLEHASFEEVSEAIGKSVGTVRAYKSRALKQLRQDEGLREYFDAWKQR
ncbi:RNA polymerase sigma factor [Salisaeta longa]|uniref:RNA polymerase sigma factor n=1 Tax=Salisaeta longa TaxID=503170 RepID=UPI0003B66971|nr:RNA polymerase sigma factor [Salisaeta longa]